MNEEIKKELESVREAGIQMANRFVFEKMIVLVVAIGAICFSVKAFDSIVYILVELLVLVTVLRFTKKMQKKLQKPLYDQCDPYLQYVVMEHYGKKWIASLKKVQDQLLISKSQCMVLAGEPQEAISILKQIENPKRMKIAYRAIYYNNLLNAYGEFCWEQKRANLVGEIKQLRNRCNPKNAMYLDVILRLEELDVRSKALDLEFVTAYFSKNIPKHLFQHVSMHYTFAVLFIKKGKMDEAKEHIDFVMKYGNKLYYKKELVKLIRRG